MAYAFNNDKSKFQLDGKILNWTKIASYNENTTFSNSSTSTATKTYLCGTSTDWENMCSNWKNYDIIRVRFEISQLQFSIPTAKSVASEVELLFENLSLGVLDAMISPAATSTTFTCSNRELFAYFRRERTMMSSDGNESVAFYSRNNLVLLPDSYRPYLNVLYATSGTFSGKIVIEGASLYTI